MRSFRVKILRSTLYRDGKFGLRRLSRKWERTYAEYTVSLTAMGEGNDVRKVDRAASWFDGITTDIPVIHSVQLERPYGSYSTERQWEIE